MKTIIILLLLLVKIDMTHAGSEPPDYIVSPHVPLFQIDNFSPVLENQTFYLWDYVPSGCFKSYSDTYVKYLGNEINVFKKFLGMVCASPPPPPFYANIAEIDGLTDGHYQLNFFEVPQLDAFPPDPNDYPNYLVENISFQVLGAVTIDSSSQFSLIILALLLLVISRKKYAQFMNQ